MDQVRDGIAEKRAHTDASLDAERAERNEGPDGQAAAAQRVRDDLIERDRIAADERLWKFRVDADRVLARQRAASLARESTVGLERRLADEGKEAERSVTDGLLERERQRADAVGEARAREHEAESARMEARRQDTDDQLSNERIDTDEAVASLGETRSALVHSERERARRRYVLSMVTHDLRSPLCVIAVNAEVIAADAQNASLREAAEEVTRAAARMERLLTDLLDVAGIESGTLSIVKRRHDVGALMTEVLRSYRPLFVDRDMTFVVDLPDAPLVASFDHDRIVQVLSNLLGNALKFMSPKGLARLRVEPGAQQLEFVLSDNGPGIRENALPHVFKQFWQIESDTRRGLGLGLYICEKIIQAHGGRIWAESVPGKGATFRFTLPAS